MNFLVFSDDWGVHPSSCQHIFRELAKRHPTIWVNTVGMRTPRLSLDDARKAARKLRGMLPRRGRSGANRSGSHAALSEHDSGAPLDLTVCAPPMLPLARPRLAMRWNFRSIERTVRRALDARGLDAPCLVTTVPNVWGAVPRCGARRVVYYCVDDFSEWPGLERETILDMERRLLPHVDRVICTSQALLDRFTDRFPSSLLTHGVDLETFSPSESPRPHPLLEHIPPPRVGYFGLLDDRTDRELVLSVARALPNVSFVLTGPTEGDLGSWRSLPNIHLTGPVPYRELPSIVAGWHACFLPYRINALTEKINPLKLKEYLACGKPVLSTALPEAVRLSDHLRIASDAGEWTRAIDEATRGAWSVDRVRTEAFLRGESWQCKADEFLRVCEAE